MNIKEIVPHYYNIAAMILAQDSNFEPLISLYGELGAFQLIKDIDTHYNLLYSSPNPEYYPIALYEGRIVRNHHYVAGAVKAGFNEISTVVKKMHVDLIDYNKDWAQQFCNNKQIKQIEEVIKRYE